MKKRLHILSAAFLLITASASLTSCKGWLKVDSPDRILEENIYSSTDGFYTALNGIYIELVDSYLYSGSFTVSTPDILAQYYDTRTDGHGKGSLALFQTEARKLALTPCWEKTYNMLLNINKVITKCDERNGTVLGEKDYSLIKGECLGLRALLHFELFRHFGPVYSVSPEAPSIPYMDTDEPQVYPILPAQEAAGRITDDLDGAMALLKDHDPVCTGGKNEKDDGGRNLYNYRNLRFNYFAVKAITARVRMYLGQSSQAKDLAESVIAEAGSFFPFSTRDEVTGQAATGTVSRSSEDRVFSSDILFGVYNVRRGADIHEKYFSNTLEPRQLLAMSESGYANMYPEESDLRTCQWERMKDKAGNDIVGLVKYQAMEVEGKSYPYLIPVIRMSELYLMCAEHYMSTGHQDKAAARLNAVRNARQTSSVDSDISTYIEKEFIREFVGEGQLFWYYKRKARNSIPCLYNMNQPAVSMDASRYTCELPQSEGGHRDEK